MQKEYDYYMLVKIFISQYLNIDENMLQENIRLFHDLGLYGNEAIDFLNSFSYAFNVDMSNFIFDKYFGMGNGFTTILYFLFRNKELINHPITLGDLAVVAKEKKWVL